MKGNYFSSNRKSPNKTNPEAKMTISDDTLRRKRRKTQRDIFLIQREKEYVSPLSTEPSLEAILNKGSFQISSVDNVKKGIPFLTKGELDFKYNSLLTLHKKNEELSFLRKDYLHSLKELDQRKRRILLDWLMEVSQLFNFQRETYHSAVVLLDIYLSKINHVFIKQFQLIGITCLLISAKNEEITIPSITNFAQTTNFAYISKEILALEREILKSLNWRIQYTNPAFWLNYLIAKWDKYTHDDLSMPKFSKHKWMSRVSFWLIDTMSFDYLHIFKNMKALVCVVLYIVIGLQLRCFSINDIKDLLLINENNIEKYPELNTFFNSFLMNVLGIELIAFGEHLSYVSLFVLYYDQIEENSNEFNDYSKQMIRMQDYAKSKECAMQLIEEKRTMQ